MKHGNLTIIGTSHIAEESVRKVKETILDEKPDVVAVELDHARLHAILSGDKPRMNLAMLRLMGITGFVFFLIGGFLQRKLGKLIGAVPGQEMKTAVEVARENSIRVALIDQPINITMRSISAIRAREKLKLITDMFLGIAGLDRESAQIDLTKTPPGSFVEMAMKKISKRYPGLYKALVSDRNEHMARVLSRIMKIEPQSRIVAVVGAGHEKEIVRILKTTLSGKEDAS